MNHELLRLDVSEETDVFTARQRARAVTGVVGFELQDQVRVATALSETGRDLVTAGGGTAAFRLPPGEGYLEVVVTGPPAWCAEPPAQVIGGLTAAHRLMDEVVVDRSPEGTQVRMRKALPRGVSFRLYEIRRLHERLSQLSPPSPLQELRVQNQDLLEALEDLRANQQELLALNAELEETNRGVMAMYSQLSSELEETNRGVVALHAELELRGEQLQHASEAKSRFLANVSHELRTPVNSVLGLCRLMAEADADPLTLDQSRQLGLMTTSAETLLALVNELLDLAKAESGRIDVRREPVDLADLFGELDPLLQPLRNPDVTLRIETFGDLPAVETDRTLLRQIAANLLSNALQFTERGEVVVSASPGVEGEVTISVADTGVGIEDEYLEAVFEEFVQVPGPLQLKRKGTGLGLPYARRLAEALGGRLTAVSEPGVGSVFSVTLPLLRASRPDEADPQPPRRAPAPRPVGTALVVDDDPAFRETLRAMLDGLVRQVVEAGDGDEALVLLDQAVPDIVFLDLRMPHVDGAEVLDRMGRAPHLSRVPVVVLSSHDLDATAGKLADHRRFLGKSQLTRADIEATMADLL